MKTVKRSFALILALILAANMLQVVCFAADGAAEPAAFTPVLRFIASSDTHVREEDNVTVDRIGKMLALGYDAADRDPAYNKLDALLIAGDLTQSGKKTEFEKFSAAVNGSLREGTRFLGVVAKNHDGYTMRRAEMRSVYTSLTGNDPDFHAVIGGYHFIGVSASSNDLMHYDAGQLAWLKKQLDAAVKDDPEKPVFVIHHEHVMNTVYGSSPYSMWGVPYFTAVLKQYPQVVDFSGHSHYPLNDPRSIWQGAFTAIGTGAVYYADFTIGAARSYDPGDEYNASTCWIVEVDAANRVRLVGMDILAGKPLCEYLLNNPADPANRDYTPAKRKASSAAPVFAAGDALTVCKNDGKSVLQIPPAQPTDGMPVVLYRVNIQNRFGVTVRRDWVLPKYYYINDQDVIEYTMRGVRAGSYTVRVCAETAYGVQSETLETQVEVDAYVCPRCGDAHPGFAGFFVALFHRIVYAFDLVI